MISFFGQTPLQSQTFPDHTGGPTITRGDTTPALLFSLFFVIKANRTKIELRQNRKN